MIIDKDGLVLPINTNNTIPIPNPKLSLINRNQQLLLAPRLVLPTIPLLPTLPLKRLAPDWIVT